MPGQEDLVHRLGAVIQAAIARPILLAHAAVAADDGGDAHLQGAGVISVWICPFSTGSSWAWMSVSR